MELQAASPDQDLSKGFQTLLWTETPVLFGSRNPA